MFDNQRDALADALARRPRGLKNGDTVMYPNMRFKVFAIQQWMVAGAPHAVGLVWVSKCPECDKSFYQCTSTRPAVLAECCPDCDVLGTMEPDLDERVAADLMDKHGGSTFPVKRRGRIETVVIDFMREHRAGADTVKLSELIDDVAAILPEPGEGERDTRRQRVTRAMETLSKEKDGPLQIKGGVVICYD